MECGRCLIEHIGQEKHQGKDQSQELVEYCGWEGHWRRRAAQALASTDCLELASAINFRSSFQDPSAEDPTVPSHPGSSRFPGLLFLVLVLLLLLFNLGFLELRVSTRSTAQALQPTQSVVGLVLLFLLIILLVFVLHILPRPQVKGNGCKGWRLARSL